MAGVGAREVGEGRAHGGLLARDLRLAQGEDAHVEHRALEQRVDGRVAHGHALGHLEQAVPFYEQAIRIAPDAAQAAFSNLGTAYYQLGRLDEARAAYGRAVAIDPGDPLKRRNLGDLHHRTGDAGAARREYQEALRLSKKQLEVNPRDARALALMAVVEAKLGRGAEAQRHAAEALALNPSSSDVVYKAAVVHALTGRPEEALLALEKALAMGFRSWEARVDDDLASLRRNERFVTLTSRKEAS